MTPPPNPNVSSLGHPGRKEVFLPFDLDQSQDSLLARFRVSRVGIWPCARDHDHIPTEPHTWYTLFVCTAGKGFLLTGNKRFQVAAGELLFLFKDLSMRRIGSVKDDPWSFAYSRFDGDEAEERIRRTGATPDNPVIRMGELDTVMRLYREMQDVLARGHTIPNLLYAASIQEKILSFIAFHRNLTLWERAADFHLEPILNYMTDHLAKPLTLDELAAKTGMSRSYFTRRFRIKTGYAPMEYMIRTRIQKACEYLENSELNIARIAELVGYDDPYYFSRLFRKITGVPPTAYRQLPRG
ncbi:helix-turn-helix transcriptional regulator [bacterium]|nr:helix-turn-helix transcriptional regulator [bacterium]